MFNFLKKAKKLPLGLHPGEKHLKGLKEELAELQEVYISGKFSGHPEEMLTSIENLKYSIQEVLTAKEANWHPDWDTITEAKSRIYRMIDSKIFNPDSAEYDKAYTVLTQRVELAKQGIIHLNHS